MTRTVVYFMDTTGYGGAERSLLNLLAGLDRRQWHPILAFHPDPGNNELVQQAALLNVELWPVLPMPEGSTGAKRVPQFARALRDRRPSVFHAHLTWQRGCKFGLIASILARVPAVIATQHLFVDIPSSWSIDLQQRVLAFGIDRYLPVSNDIAGQLHERLSIPTHKLQVIHNGIPIGQFSGHSERTVRAQLNAGTERPIILTPARLVEQKGHRYLLQAMTRLPSAVLVLAGDGPERWRLEAQTQQLGLDGRVRFLGHRDDAGSLLAAADLVVLPSLFEGLPLSIVEAMAAGKPVVTTSVGGIPEAIIDGESGLLVPAADPDALANAIGQVLRDPALAQRLATRARERAAAEFSLEGMVAAVTGVYDEVLA